MKRMTLMILMLLILAGCVQTPTTNEISFDDLERISFSDLDQMIEQKKSGLVYFGWVEGCGDAVNIQNNFFNPMFKSNPQWKDQMYVVDLDVELPEGLTDKDARQPMIDAYQVMYSPTLIMLENGMIIDKIEWTPLTSDKETAIPRSVIEAFLTKHGFMKP